MTQNTLDLPVPEDDLFARLRAVSAAFSPSSPITVKELFAGRTAQLNRIEDVTMQRGQHALVYGDRGVGKTSLARVGEVNARARGSLTAYTVCSTMDSYGTIWHNALTELDFEMRKPGVGFKGDPVVTVTSPRQLLPDTPTPDDVRRALEVMSSAAPVVIFIDEFDRIEDMDTRTQFADTIKILSDRSVAATIVLVGVAESVTELLDEHASVQRSLVQVQMPLMRPDEISTIVISGMQKAGLGVQDSFVNRVVEFSQGLPHYAHLIAQHGARHAVEKDAAKVLGRDSTVAVNLALDDVSQSIREAYHRATWSNRDTLYTEVLTACALARKNDIGEFGSADVREPLTRITNRNYEIAAFSSHLNQFSSDEKRGGILRQLGSRARFQYRFVDALMPPYVLMRAHAAGLI